MRKRIEIDIEKAKSLYDSGLSLTRVGQELGVSHRVIFDRFKEAGVQKRKPTRPHKAKSTNIKERAGSRRICSCCGLNLVPEKPVNGAKLTRLCYRCYTSAAIHDDDHGRPPRAAVRGLS